MEGVGGQAIQSMECRPRAFTSSKHSRTQSYAWREPQIPPLGLKPSVGMTASGNQERKEEQRRAKSEKRKSNRLLYSFPMKKEMNSSRKLSYACGTATVPLLGKCIGEVLDDTAAAHPDNDALVVRHQRKRYSYAELRHEVERAARGLLALGIRKGDRIGIWATNCAEWVVTQFATAKVGAILVNINPANRSMELEYALHQSECQALLLIQGFRDVDYVQVVREVCPESEQSRFGEMQAAKLPELRRLIFMGANSPDPADQEPVDVPRGMLAWSELLQMGAGV